jgi:hypothetical protein
MPPELTLPAADPSASASSATGASDSAAAADGKDKDKEKGDAKSGGDAAALASEQFAYSAKNRCVFAVPVWRL